VFSFGSNPPGLDILGTGSRMALTQDEPKPTHQQSRLVAKAIAASSNHAFILAHSCTTRVLLTPDGGRQLTLNTHTHTHTNAAPCSRRGFIAGCAGLWLGLEYVCSICVFVAWLF
jgi:hypothetical protein